LAHKQLSVAQRQSCGSGSGRSKLYMVLTGKDGQILFEKKQKGVDGDRPSVIQPEPTLSRTRLATSVRLTASSGCLLFTGE